MTEPVRFLESHDGGFEAQLLGASGSEHPPRGARERTARALGLSAGLVAMTSVAAAEKASLGVPTVTKMSLLGLGKWLGIGLIAGAVTTTGIHVVAHRFVEDHGASQWSRGASVAARANATNTVEARAAVNDVARASAELAGTAIVPVPTPEDQPSQNIIGAGRVALPSERGAAPAVPSTGNPPGATNGAAAPSSATNGMAVGSFAAVASAAPASNPSIAGELTLLNSARSALLGGDAKGALAALDTYEHTSHSGVLESEAEVLRIEALLRLGDRASAVARANRFLSRSPESPHAGRLREIVAAAR